MNKKDWVRFRVSDVFLPSPEDLLHVPLADREIEGTIVDFSDSGLKLRAFAVVEVVNGRTMVVAVEKLTLITPASPESEP